MRRLLMITLPALLAGCSLTPSDPVVIPGETAAPRPANLFGDSFSAPAGSGMLETLATGTFEPKGTTAITYDPRLVPAGATAQVAMGTVAGGIAVRLAVTGMLPRRTYGAHLHTKPCTAEPAEAGPHYQHSAAPSVPASTKPSASAKPPASAKPSASAKRSAPAKPSASGKASPSPSAPASPAGNDPAYANPKNEVWLDFAADRAGRATATAVLAWTFDESAPPRSVVVHATRTRTEEGLAGTAGERIACLTLPG